MQNCEKIKAQATLIFVVSGSLLGDQPRLASALFSGFLCVCPEPTSQTARRLFMKLDMLDNVGRFPGGHFIVLRSFSSWSAP